MLGPSAAVHVARCTERIRWIHEQGVNAYGARRGRTELEMRRHAILLRWVAEQLSIVVSETASSSSASTSEDTLKTGLATTWRGKDQTLDLRGI